MHGNQLKSDRKLYNGSPRIPPPPAAHITHPAPPHAAAPLLPLPPPACAPAAPPPAACTRAGGPPASRRASRRCRSTTGPHNERCRGEGREEYAWSTACNPSRIPTGTARAGWAARQSCPPAPQAAGPLPCRWPALPRRVGAAQVGAAACRSRPGHRQPPLLLHSRQGQPLLHQAGQLCSRVQQLAQLGGTLSHAGTSRQTSQPLVPLPPQAAGSLLELHCQGVWHAGFRRRVHRCRGCMSQRHNGPIPAVEQRSRLWRDAVWCSALTAQHATPRIHSAQHAAHLPLRLCRASQVLDSLQQPAQQAAACHRDCKARAGRCHP